MRSRGLGAEQRRASQTPPLAPCVLAHGAPSGHGRDRAGADGFNAERPQLRRPQAGLPSRRGRRAPRSRSSRASGRAPPAVTQRGGPPGAGSGAGGAASAAGRDVASAAVRRRGGQRPGPAMGVTPPNCSLGAALSPPPGAGPGERGCENGALMDSFGIFLQGLLGVLAFSILMREWRPGRAAGGGAAAGERAGVGVRAAVTPLGAARCARGSAGGPSALRSAAPPSALPPSPPCPAPCRRASVGRAACSFTAAKKTS